MHEPIEKCPLCGSSQWKELEKINTEDIKQMYYKSLKVSIINEFDRIQTISLNHCASCDLLFFLNAVTGSKDFYRQLQKFDWYYMNDKNEYDYAKNYIRNDHDVLEIGCGKGIFMKKIKSKSYIGLEYSPDAIKDAKERNLSVFNQSIEEHALKNENRYDVVTAFQVLEHIANLKLFIKSCISCLKPNGLLIYSIPSQESFIKYSINTILDMPPHHVTRWSDNALKSIGRFYNLDIVDLWHEPLQSVHKLFYAQTVYLNAFYKFFKIPKKSISVGIFTKMTLRLCMLFGKVFSYGLISQELLPRGISVTAVFKKKPHPVF